MRVVLNDLLLRKWWRRRRRRRIQWGSNKNVNEVVCIPAD